MPMDLSWEKTKKILLTHSVQRPPFSISIFSLADLQAISHYLLHTFVFNQLFSFYSLRAWVMDNHPELVREICKSRTICWWPKSIAQDSYACSDCTPIIYYIMNFWNIHSNLDLKECCSVVLVINVVIMSTSQCRKSFPFSFSSQCCNLKNLLKE